MTSINITQLTKVNKAINDNNIGINSPELIKAVITACQGELSQSGKWVRASEFLYRADIRAAHFNKKTFDKGVVESVESVVVQSLTPQAQTLLAAKTIDLNSTQRAERELVKVHVKTCMNRIAFYLKKFENAENKGSDEKAGLGETLAGLVQELIDRVRAAKEGKLDFDAPEAIVALKVVKAILLK